MRPSPAQRYWLSLSAVVLVTILLAGTASGAVIILTDRAANGLWGTATFCLVALMGWQVVQRLRERKKLGLPLWSRLGEEDARRLAQFRSFSRTDRISEPKAQEVADAGRPPASPGLSRRDRARQASVEAQKRARQAARERRTDRKQ